MEAPDDGTVDELDEDVTPDVVSETVTAPDVHPALELELSRLENDVQAARDLYREVRTELREARRVARLDARARRREQRYDRRLRRRIDAER